MVPLTENALANFLYTVGGAAGDISALPVDVGDGVSRRVVTDANAYMSNRSTGGTTTGQDLVLPRVVSHRIEGEQRRRRRW